MTRYVAVTLLIVAAISGRAETPEQFFDQANQAYQRGKFAEAIEKYEAILASGLVSGELYYNLGNAYYKSGNLGKAILNYERALRLLPHDEDIRHNLQLANLLITDRVEPAPRLFIWDWWDAVKGWFTLSGITLWGYAFYLLVLMGIGAVVLAPAYSLRRVALIASTAAFALLVFSLLVFVGKLNDVQRTDVGIVIASVTTVKNSPDANSTDAFVLHSGAKVWVTDRVNTWLKIRIADGKLGWMDERAAELI